MKIIYIICRNEQNHPKPSILSIFRYLFKRIELARFTNKNILKSTLILTSLE